MNSSLLYTEAALTILFSFLMNWKYFLLIYKLIYTGYLSTQCIFNLFMKMMTFFYPCFFFSLDTFHEVKRKRDRRKVVSESNGCILFLQLLVEIISLTLHWFRLSALLL